MAKEFVRHLQAAEGYFELGMFQDAWAELQHLKPEDWKTAEVMILQLHILQALKKWEAGAALGEVAVEIFPDCGPLYLATAYCVRRARCIEDARALLLSAEELLKEDALFHYNVGCYECQLGDLGASLERLETAFKLDPQFRKIAAADSDLQPLWSVLDQRFPKP